MGKLWSNVPRTFYMLCIKYIFNINNIQGFWVL